MSIPISLPPWGLTLNEMLRDCAGVGQGQPPGGDPVPDRCGGRLHD